jgi:uncharacterized membrane-anchored protein
MLKEYYYAVRAGKHARYFVARSGTGLPDLYVTHEAAKKMIATTYPSYRKNMRVVRVELREVK